MSLALYPGRLRISSECRIISLPYTITCFRHSALVSVLLVAILQQLISEPSGYFDWLSPTWLLISVKAFQQFTEYFYERSFLRTGPFNNKPILKELRNYLTVHQVFSDLDYHSVTHSSNKSWQAVPNYWNIQFRFLI